MIEPIEGIKPMKMTDVNVASAEDYLVDPNLVLEQKMDGARALIHARRQEDGTYGYLWLASGGGEMKFSAALLKIKAVEKTLDSILGSYEVVKVVLDGELIIEEGELRLFDMPYLEFDTPHSLMRQEFGGIDWPETTLIVKPFDPFAWRRVMLQSLLRGAADHGEHVTITRQAQDYADKLKLWDEIQAANVEGGMLKDVHAPYESGMRTKTQLKLKLVKTADVIVTSVERIFKPDGKTVHKGSAEFAVRIRPEDDPAPWRSEVTGKRISRDAYDALANGTKAQMARAVAHTFDPRRELPIGSASLIGKDLTIAPGDVVEIAYLYFQDAPIQPRILRKRLPEEKTADECTLAQFPEYSRAAV